MPPFDVPDDVRARIITLLEQCLDVLEAPSLAERSAAPDEAIDFMLSFHKMNGRWPLWYEIFEGAKAWKGRGY